MRTRTAEQDHEKEPRLTPRNLVCGARLDEAVSLAVRNPDLIDFQRAFDEWACDDQAESRTDIPYEIGPIVEEILHFASPEMAELLDAELTERLVAPKHPYETAAAASDRQPLRMAAAVQIALHLRSYPDPREAAEWFVGTSFYSYPWLEHRLKKSPNDPRNPTLGSRAAKFTWWIYHPPAFLAVLSGYGVRIFGAKPLDGRINRWSNYTWSDKMMDFHPVIAEPVWGNMRRTRHTEV